MPYRPPTDESPVRILSRDSGRLVLETDSALVLRKLAFLGLVYPGQIIRLTHNSYDIPQVLLPCVVGPAPAVVRAE